MTKLRKPDLPPYRLVDSAVAPDPDTLDPSRSLEIPDVAPGPWPVRVGREVRESDVEPLAHAGRQPREVSLGPALEPDHKRG